VFSNPWHMAIPPLRMNCCRWFIRNCANWPRTKWPDRLRVTRSSPQPLVHEAWLRLAGSEPGRFAGRAHFFAAAAEAMRHILIDSARRKRAVRHGGGQVRVDIENLEIASLADDDELLAVHEVLDKLAAEDPQKAELIKLRYFVGMTFEEAAEVLGISVATAKRHWAYARAFLYEK
jgi:RNA polymerase sigma factor (TIGR02999 family)